MTGKKNRAEVLQKNSLYITLGLHLLILLIFLGFKLEKGFLLSSKKYIIQFAKEDKTKVEETKAEIKNDKSFLKRQADKELQKLYSLLPQNPTQEVADMDANLSEISAMIENARTTEQGNISLSKPTQKLRNTYIKRDTTLAEAPTTTKMSLIAINLPNRYQVFIETPVFKCKGGGKVLVRIKVNQEGSVTDANVKSVDKKISKCIHNAAFNAAINTVFNPNMNAPKVQHGEILYNFIEQ